MKIIFLSVFILLITTLAGLLGWVAISPSWQHASICWFVAGSIAYAILRISVVGFPRRRRMGVMEIVKVEVSMFALYTSGGLFTCYYAGKGLVDEFISFFDKSTVS